MRRFCERSEKREIQDPLTDLPAPDSDSTDLPAQDCSEHSKPSHVITAVLGVLSRSSAMQSTSLVHTCKHTSTARRSIQASRNFCNNSLVSWWSHRTCPQFLADVLAIQLSLPHSCRWHWTPGYAACSAASTILSSNMRYNRPPRCIRHCSCFVSSAEIKAANSVSFVLLFSQQHPILSLLHGETPPSRPPY